MSNDPLNEHEFELVNIIGAALAANQRDLSRQLNLSLGMTNMLLRRLVTKGYIRIKQLNRRKVEYILTAKGFSEKMRKSIKYTQKTINSIGLIKKRLTDLLKPLYEQGQRYFYVLGESDLAALIEIVLREHCHQANIIYIKNKHEAKPEGIILLCTAEPVEAALPGQQEINLIEQLATHV